MDFKLITNGLFVLLLAVIAIGSVMAAINVMTNNKKNRDNIISGIMISMTVSCLIIGGVWYYVVSLK